MLSKTRCLVALMALGSVLAVATALRDTSDYCSEMRYQMLLNKEQFPNAWAAFEGMKKLLDSTPIVFFNLESKLLKSWEKVLENDACDENSAEYVRVTAGCRAQSFPQVASMGEAVKKYAQKCLTPSFWDENLEKVIGAHRHSGLNSFISDEFIAQYRADNPNERQVHFDVLGSNNCCEPEHAHGALIKALEKIFGDAKTIKEDSAYVKHTLEVNLFQPCERYNNKLDHLMDQAEAASELHQQGKDGFFDSLSADFQNAIFRYKFCESFIFMPTTDLKMSKINMDKLVAKV